MPALSKTSVGLAVTAAILLVQLAGVPFIRQLDNKFLDLKFHLRGPVEPASPIVLVTIDQKSIEQVGKWPWPREKIAELTMKIADRRPKVIALDFVFSEPSYRPEGDEKLACAIREAGNVALGALLYISPGEGRFQTQSGFEENLSLLSNARINIIRRIDDRADRLSLLTAYGALASIPEISGSARGQGFYNVLPEGDGCIRYGPLLVQANEKIYHSLAVAVARIWRGAQNVELITESSYVLRLNLYGKGGTLWEVPTDRMGRIFINYYGDGTQFRRVSAGEIISGKGHRVALADSIVLVGGTSLGDFDTAETPFNPAMPSIQVQATIADNIIGDRALRSGYPAMLINRMAVVFLGLLMSLLLPRLRRVSWGVGLLCGLLAATALVDYVLFSRFRLVIESIYPLSAILGTYLCITIYGYAVLTREIRHFDRALSGVGATVSARLEIEEFLPRILSSVVSHLGAERGLIALSKGPLPDSLESIRFDGLFAFHNIDADTVFGDSFLRERTVINEALASREPRLVEEAWSGGRFRLRSAMHAARSIICVPVIVQDRAGGVVYIDSGRGGKQLSQNELKIITALTPALSTAIENALLYTELKNERELLRGEVVYLKKEIEDSRLRNIIGKSPAMRAVFGLIEKAAASPISVLVSGETGTGKELVARAIHYLSERREKLLVTQSCAALPEQLLESELFGHRKGAFTGAVADKKGLFEIADGGTMFLDEIGDAPPSVQVKLLRVLQEGLIRPVGGLSEKKVDVRIISATNKNLEEEVGRGAFREDLYYRLNALQIELPPLRKRREDIPLLAAHFLEKYTQELRKEIRGFSADAMAFLCSYDYPGNVRELENEIQRAVAIAPAGEAISAGLLSEKTRGPRLEPEGTPQPPGEGRTLKETLEMVEKQVVLNALRRCGFNRTLAAAELGVSRSGLRLIMKRLKIELGG